jgi:hypothetical protein
MSNDEELRQAVLASSQKWIEAFNKGDTDNCVASKMD